MIDFKSCEWVKRICVLIICAIILWFASIPIFAAESDDSPVEVVVSDVIYETNEDNSSDSSDFSLYSEPTIDYSESLEVIKNDIQNILQTLQLIAFALVLFGVCVLVSNLFV